MGSTTVLDMPEKEVMHTLGSSFPSGVHSPQHTGLIM
jgi:hypothetical protein